MYRAAIIYYSLYGHVANLAQSVKKGAESEGVEVTLFQVPETLTADVLSKLGAPPRNPDVPTITAEDMKNFDGFAFGSEFVLLLLVSYGLM